MISGFNKDAKVKAAFVNEPTALIDKYFDMVASRLDAVNSGMRRSALLIIVFSGLHYLLFKTVISQASVGGFEIEDLSLVRSILPAVIAFFYYDLASGLALSVELEGLSASLMRHAHVGVWQGRLLPYLLPPHASIFGSPLLPIRPSTWLTKAATFFQSLSVIVVLLAPPFYVIRAVKLEFREFGPLGWEEIAAVAVALILLGYGVLLLAMAFLADQSNSLVPPDEGS